MRSLYKVLKQQDTFHIEDYGMYPELDILPFGEEEEEPEEDEAGEEEEPAEEEIILAKAIEQAEEIMETARKEGEKIKELSKIEGYKKGEEEGFDAGMQQALVENREKLRAEMEGLQNRISQYVKEIEIEKEKLLEQYIDDLKNISLAIGEKIVPTSLKSSSDVIEKMILSATEKLKKTAWAKIYVGQGTKTMDIRGDVKFLNELSKLSNNVKIIVMEAEEPGTCIVELPDEIIDISVGTQLENIKEILNNARLQ